MGNTRLNQLYELLKEDPDDSFLKYAIALEYIKEGDQDNGEKALVQLISEDTNYAAAYYQYGKILENKMQPEKAREIYINGIKAAEVIKDKLTARELRQALADIDE